ncbi:MAG: RNA polymerase sigma-54 factor [Candidatus Rokuibacteriota bacterium]|nr:MAG: RNA polymerase sigma-54 factor [Candidatus Rokubacteria bacterium]
MAMETRLSLRQSQRVVMTPLLQQAIQLLQLSTLELQEVVQKELLENPLLEEVQPETAEQPEGKDAPPDVPTAPPSEPLSSDAAPAPTTERQTDDLPFDLTAVMFDDHEERSLVAQEDREDLPFENMVRSVSSLTDHLDEQLRYASDSPLVRRIGTEIIGNLDEDGYLRASDEEIAQRCETTVEEVAKVVKLVQSFDPPGVAARSIQECLLIQLKADPNPDPVSVEIVEEHFEDLSRRRYPDIARALKLPLDRIMESVEEIMGLEPKPGRRFGGNDSRYIVPDVVVHKMGSEYVVVLNEDGIPRLRVNSLYRSLLRSNGDKARAYVEKKLRSAVWLIKSVDQRQRTLRKVTQSIVKFQREFLDKGLPYLRPLSLRDVGEDIGMHESTISRVTTNKYVETPQGLFELKFFFHSGIASGDGEMVSSVSVKKMIQDLLANEDPSKPLSDQEVALILKGRGLTIARRTVAKYREELGILPSHQRRLAPKRR